VNLGADQGEPDPSGQPGVRAPSEVVCCSLEPWDEVWRRNQLVATELLRLRPSLRLLFVEPPVDVPRSLARRRRPAPSGLRSLGDSGRLWAVTPRKWLPRRIWAGVDQALGQQVLDTVRRVGFERPVLWVNDSTYAPLVKESGWPSIYDVTDDWLLAGHAAAELDRQQRNDRLLVDTVAEVVVCSSSLQETRGRSRQVHLIPNGVDVAHFRQPQPRPADLPAGRTMVYAGSLHDDRLDVDLCVELSARLAGRATLVLVGPNSLTEESGRRLREAGAVLLGGRPYRALPGYLQHADALVVPHLVTPFTESLDPIKARELLAVGRPTVSTPVAGFRGLGAPTTVVTAEHFVAAVEILVADPMPPGPGPLVSAPASWADRAIEFLAVLDAAASQR
jgi:teichuronic acid biosynthesis glycosyltransferase TuaH